ncbi:MAG: Smr/MutS family protein [Gemmatimonadaceae bacterium]
MELKHAFDEARFGADRTLNLRSMLPTAAEAARRTNAWLRERQASGVSEVLIISGRGNGSEGGYSVVREAVARTLRQLKRQGVVDTSDEHSPGSFVARLAPMRRLLEGARRTTPARTDVPGSAAVNGLDPETAALLRALAERALDALGVRQTEAFLDREMATQFAALLRGVPPGDGRDERLREVMRRTLDDDDDRTR